jgi:DNA-binding transcriptional ArsR family regulator
VEAAEVPTAEAPSPLGLSTDHAERSAPSKARSALGAPETSESTSASALTEDEAVVLARRLQVFSSPNRLRLLWELLDGEQRVGELARSVGMSPSLTSHQLRVMREAGLTVARKEGTRAYYRLHDTNLRDLLVAIRGHHAASKVTALADAAFAGEASPVLSIADHRPRRGG